MSPLYRNIANLVVFVRTLIVLLAVVLLEGDSAAVRFVGLGAVALAAALDGMDGYLARRLSIVSRIGGQLDTLGDRVAENVLFIFFAVGGYVSLWVPIVFVTRSFLADFVRSLHDSRGLIGTFAMNTSSLGHFLVASRGSRAGYLLLKFFVFMAGGLFMALSGKHAPVFSMVSLRALRGVVWWGSVAATAVNLIRFAVLLYDSRTLLQEEFGL